MILIMCHELGQYDHCNRSMEQPLFFPCETAAVNKPLEFILWKEKYIDQAVKTNFTFNIFTESLKI